MNSNSQRKKIENFSSFVLFSIFSRRRGRKIEIRNLNEEVREKKHLLVAERESASRKTLETKDERRRCKNIVREFPFFRSRLKIAWVDGGMAKTKRKDEEEEEQDDITARAHRERARKLKQQNPSPQWKRRRKSVHREKRQKK